MYDDYVDDDFLDWLDEQERLEDEQQAMFEEVKRVFETCMVVTCRDDVAWKLYGTFELKLDLEESMRGFIDAWREQSGGFPQDEVESFAEYLFEEEFINMQHRRGVNR